MLPTLHKGCLVVAASFFGHVAAPGDVVVFRHNGLEKLKRVQDVADGRVFVVGDNLDESTDSRTFGWVADKAILGKVIWPRRLNARCKDSTL